MAAVNITSKLQTPEEMRELFLWKYRDITRDELNSLLVDFRKFDKLSRGELEYDEVMMLLEHRGTVKTAKELMDAAKSMDSDGNRRVSFIELCCYNFNRSYHDLFIFVDEEARERAMSEVRGLAEEARKVEEEMERARAQKELQAQLRADALEKESKLTGVAGMKAFFARQVEGAQDVTKTNEQQIKEEAARRKALREAKMKMNEAMEQANKVKSAEDIAREVAEAAERQRAEEEAAKKKADDEEKAIRAARKAALNAKWSGGSVPMPKTN